MFPDNPWGLAKLAVLCLTMALMLHINYAHGFVAKDFLTIIATLSSVLGVAGLQKYLDK